MKVGSGSSSMADDDMARRPSTFDASSTPSLLPCLSSPPSEREARSVKWNTRNVLGSTFSFFLFFFSASTLTLTWIPFLLVSSRFEEERREEGEELADRIVDEIEPSNKFLGIVRWIFCGGTSHPTRRPRGVNLSDIGKRERKRELFERSLTLLSSPPPPYVAPPPFFPPSTRPCPCFNECKFLFFFFLLLFFLLSRIRTLSRDLRQQKPERWISVYIPFLLSRLWKIKFPWKRKVGRGGWRGGIFITRVYGDNSRPRPVFSSKFYSPLSLSLSPSLFYSRAGEGCNEARTRPREYLGPTIAIPRIGTIRPWPGKRHASDNPISE